MVVLLHFLRFVSCFFRLFTTALFQHTSCSGCDTNLVPVSQVRSYATSRAASASKDPRGSSAPLMASMACTGSSSNVSACARTAANARPAQLGARMLTRRAVSTADLETEDDQPASCLAWPWELGVRPALARRGLLQGEAGFYSGDSEAVGGCSGFN